MLIYLTLTVYSDPFELENGVMTTPKRCSILLLILHVCVLQNLCFK